MGVKTPIRPPTCLNKYFFDRHGVPATVVTYAEGANDAYGIPAKTTTTTSVDKAILSFSRRVITEEDRVQGVQFIIEAEVYLLSSDFEKTGITAPMAPDKKRPQITIGQGVYDIFEVENPKNIGVVRMICRKKRVGG